jgi:hypothetical protein
MGNAAGDWSVSGGALRQSAGDNGDPTILWHSGLGAVGDVVVEAKVAVGGVFTGNGPYIGVLAAFTDNDPALDGGYGCAVRATDGGTETLFADFVAAALTPETAPEFSMDTGDVLIIHHYQYGGTTTICQGQDTAGDVGRTTSSGYVAGATMGAVGVMSSNIVASFRSVTVYGLGGAGACTPPALCF